MTIRKTKNDAVKFRQREIPGSYSLADYHPEKNKWLVGSIFILTIVFAFFVNRVGFDQDMMHMNYMPAKLKTAESTLNKINAYSLRSVYLVTEGKNLRSRR